ncbi:hypothetical protein L4D13_15845 [Photobacterium profundum]|uniref:putative glycoside hydrolase n=1 Tax=Photobacterium profundum TaxID=74109 RepID=UPI003D0CFDC5
MMFKKSTLALMMVSTFALTGCLDDNYDYDGGNGGGGGNGGSGGSANELGLQVPLYHNDPKDYDSPYVMSAIDADGTETAVDGNALPTSSNINVEGDFADVAPLTVTISEDKASLQFSADKTYDISKADLFNAEKSLGGSVQFYVKTLSYDLGEDPANPNPVLLTLANGDKKFSADITSAVIASVGESTQFIRVPLACFVNDGLDLTDVDMAMAIETEGAITYEFSQARMANNSVALTPANGNIQGCYNNNNSKVLADEEAIILRDTNDAENGWTLSGETQDIRITRGSAISVTNNGNDAGTIRARGINYDDKFDTSKRSILSFAIDKASELKDMTMPRLDISHYMANGELQAELIIPNNGSVIIPTEGDLELVMQFYGPGNNTEGMVIDGDSYGNSLSVTYNLTEADVQKGTTLDIAIPLNNFFTSANGQVSLNALQYVEKLETHLQVNHGEDSITFSELAGFRYALGDIKLVMNPQTPPAPDAE